MSDTKHDDGGPALHRFSDDWEQAALDACPYCPQSIERLGPYDGGRWIGAIRTLATAAWESGWDSAIEAMQISERKRRSERGTP